MEQDLSQPVREFTTPTSTYTSPAQTTHRPSFYTQLITYRCHRCGSHRNKHCVHTSTADQPRKQSKQLYLLTAVSQGLEMFSRRGAKFAHSAASSIARRPVGPAAAVCWPNRSDIAAAVPLSSPNSSSTERAPAASGSSLCHTELEVRTALAQSTVPETEGLAFGTRFTDHMLEVEWTKTEGWGVPRIVPFHNISLHPAAHALHYAVEIFEGMKAYAPRSDNEEPRLFRPVDNMIRMNLSAKRMCLPTFDPVEMAKLIASFVQVEQRWIPQGKGHSLYIRPTLISKEDCIALGTTTKALFYAIASPVGPYFASGFKAVKLLATTKYVRAPHGGTGDAKCGGNYGGTIKAEHEARKAGCAQNLWLLGDDEQVTEAGTMNFFMLWRPKAGAALELITPPLDGTILPGLTRDTVLRLAQVLRPDLRVAERSFCIEQVCKAAREGRIVEAFGTGTACVLCPVAGIVYQGNEYTIPTGSSSSTDDSGTTLTSSEKDSLRCSQAGDFTRQMSDLILDIQHGRVRPPQDLQHWCVELRPQPQPQPQPQPHDSYRANYATL